MTRAPLLIVVGLIAAAGCDSALETGYVPRSLNASDADRRSYYAPAYTPESHPDKDGVNINLPKLGPG